MAFGVTAVGTRLVQRYLRGVQRGISEMQRRVMRDIVNLLRRGVRRNFRQVVQRRTGRLIRGVGTSVRRRGSEWEGRVTESPRAFYWFFIEEGTSRLPALQPVATTLEEEQQTVEEALNRGLRDLVEIGG